MKRLENKVAIITGASGGIGLATTKRFLDEGAKVLAIDLNEEALAEVKEEVNDENLHTITADVSDEEDVKRYIDEAIEKFGKIDIVFNNAGILGDVEKFQDHKIETFDKLYQVNVRGVALGMLHTIPHMQKQGSGSIINTSSISGMVATPGFAPYEMSKHAVIGLTNAAAISVAEDGVRVNSIHPSQVDTSMVNDVEAGMKGDGDVDSTRANLQEAIPMGRYAKPEEVASLVLFLASDDSEFVTGSQYRVDGGLLS